MAFSFLLIGAVIVGPAKAFAATLYYNAAVDQDWGNASNWWTDAGFTIPGTVPTIADDAIVSDQVVDNSSAPASVNSLDFTGGGGGDFFWIDITVVTTATFNNSSNVSIGTITGNVVFNDNSVNNDSITGDATFNDSSINYATITGSATFNQTSYNESTGVVSTNATFNDTSYCLGTVNGDVAIVGTYYGAVAPSGGVFTIDTGKQWGCGAQGFVYGSDAALITSFVFNGNSSNSFGARIPADATFNNTSQNNGDITGNATFNDTAVGSSGGAIDGDATFNSTHGINIPYATGGVFSVQNGASFSSTILGNIYGDDAQQVTDFIFYGNAQNQGSFVADATFNDHSRNYGTVDGNATFSSTVNDGGGNYGTVTGDATFNTYSLNNGGTVNGNATFNDDSATELGGDVLGLATFNDNTQSLDYLSGDARFNTTYYGVGVAPSVGIFYVSINRTWYGGVAGTIYGSDNQVITDFSFDGTGSNSGTIYNQDVTFTDSTRNLGIITGNVVFNGSGYNGGTITGNATFNATSYNDLGTVNGDATMNTTYYDPQVALNHVFQLTGTVWNGEVTGAFYGSDALLITSVEFKTGSSNTGTLHTDSNFNNDSFNSGTVDADATFNDTSYNVGPVNGHATFNDTSYNTSTITGDATFNSTYYNPTVAVDNVFTITGVSWSGEVTGTLYGSDALPITSVEFATGSSNAGTLHVDTKFYNDSFNTGTVDADAFFYDASHNDMTLNYNGHFYDASYNNGVVALDAYVYCPKTLPLDGIGLVSGSTNYVDCVTPPPTHTSPTGGGRIPTPTTTPPITSNPTTEPTIFCELRENVSFKTKDTNATEQSQIKYFNPAIGVLTSVSIWHSISVNAEQKVENLADHLMGFIAKISSTSTLTIPSHTSVLKFENSTGTIQLAAKGDPSGKSVFLSGPIAETQISKPIVLTSPVEIAKYISNAAGGVDISEDVKTSSFGAVILSSSGPGPYRNAPSINISSSATVIYDYVSYAPCVFPSTPHGEDPVPTPDVPDTDRPIDDTNPNTDPTTLPPVTSIDDTANPPGVRGGDPDETTDPDIKKVRTPFGSVDIKSADLVAGVFSFIGIASFVYLAISNLISTYLPNTGFSSLLSRMLTLFFGFFGLRRRNHPWGTVYDSVTKQPLDPAYVVMYDMNGKEVQSAITDLDGRYGFVLPQGTYRMNANKTHYVFPSEKLAGRTSDELYTNLYFGESFDASSSGEVVIRNIPMDAVGFDWNEYAKRKNHLMLFYSKRDLWVGRILDGLFIFGFAATAILLFFTPNVFNATVFGLYLVFALLHLLGLTSRAFGIVKDKATGLPLSFAIVTIFSEALEAKLAEKVTDKAGRYFCLVPPGKYYVSVQKKNDDGSYSLVYTSPVFHTKKGTIRGDLEV